MTDPGPSAERRRGSAAADDRPGLPAGLAALVADLVDALSGRGETVATAESLTGGLIGASITSVAGSSAIYRGGVISYATDLKSELAGVPPATLTEHGAVAGPTAAAMARGAATRCGADWGIAVTGVAGPDEQEGHPAGTVYAAVARWPGSSGTASGAHTDTMPSGGKPCPVTAAGTGPACWVRHYEFSGDRSQVRLATVRAALQLLAGVLAS